MTLSCTMTYRRLIDKDHGKPVAKFSTSISWESAAGKFLSKNSTANDLGEKLEVDVVTLASKTKIPSYKCTTKFQFTQPNDKDATYALNDVSFTCTSLPVYTWCMYIWSCRDHDQVYVSQHHLQFVAV